MNNWKRYIILFLLISILLTGAGALIAQTGGGYSLTWSTTDGGGGTVSGGNYTMSGTAGQPDAATLTGGNYTVAGGFWKGGSSSNQSFVYLPMIIK